MEHLSLEQARRESLRLLRYRPRSRSELAETLKARSHDDATIELLLVELEKESLINDERFARYWAESKRNTQGFGSLRVEKELLAKGIEAALVQKVLQEIFVEEEQTDDEAAVRALLIKQLGSDSVIQDEKQRYKWAHKLVRKGFPLESISRVIGEVEIYES